MQSPESVAAKRGKTVEDITGKRTWQTKNQGDSVQECRWCLPKHQACVKGLGLRRIGHTVEDEDTPSVRGMINKVSYMVRVEE